VDSLRQAKLFRFDDKEHSKLLDVQFTKIVGDTADTRINHTEHTLFVPDGPGRARIAIDSDKLIDTGWPGAIVTYLPPGATLYSRPLMPVDATSITIPTHWFDEAIRASAEFAATEFRFFSTGEDRYLTSALQMLSTFAFATEPIKDQMLMEACIVHVVGRVLGHLRTEKDRRADEHPPLSKKKVMLIERYIEENMEKALRLNVLAGLVDLSVFHFSRAFAAATGESPIRYVTRKRIERAKKLLSNTSSPLADVALQCGFSSQSHLTTRFKSATGVTPARFRGFVKGPLYTLAGLAAYNQELLAIVDLLA
jgi:AraC-like DNA-binding protein